MQNNKSLTFKQQRINPLQCKNSCIISKIFKIYDQYLSTSSILTQNKKFRLNLNLLLRRRYFFKPNWIIWIFPLFHEVVYLVETKVELKALKVYREEFSSERKTNLNGKESKMKAQENS